MNTSKILLRNKKRQVVSNSLVSKEDYSLLNTIDWRLACGSGEAIAKIDGKLWEMKSFVYEILMGNDSEYEIEHVNGNKLDNTRENLKLSMRSMFCGHRCAKNCNCNSETPCCSNQMFLYHQKVNRDLRSKIV